MVELSHEDLYEHRKLDTVPLLCTFEYTALVCGTFEPPGNDGISLPLYGINSIRRTDSPVSSPGQTEYVSYPACITVFPASWQTQHQYSLRLLCGRLQTSRACPRGILAQRAQLKRTSLIEPGYLFVSDLRERCARHMHQTPQSPPTTQDAQDSG